MYDPFAQGIIENLPDLEGLTSDGTRRALSQAYFALITMRLRRAREVPSEAIENLLFLRRLANTLESRAVFDIGVEAEERRASAFVAAEALSLLAGLREILSTSVSSARIAREEVFSRVEASLLYIIAGYDANAGGVIREIPSNSSEPSGNPYREAEFHASEWTLDALINLCTFHLNPLPASICPVNFVEETPNSLVDLEYDVRGKLYAKLGEAVRSYMGWLTGEVPESIATAREQLSQMTERLKESQYPTHADIHHLARLLLVVMDNTESRSLVHAIPLPEPENANTYQDYLRIRSKGPEGGSGRPLLWPSVQKYVEECLPGPNRHAVVSMPTGSGKSFFAELAISQALSHGWVLYLVPTNALAYQARRDLRRDLGPLEADVRAFVGDNEYTALEGERATHVPSGTVVVMTPEKCSLSMRLNPETFNTCVLCVFDECHLLGSVTRGVIAELVLSQLMVLAPQCRFLLMSAMVQNPSELAEWLHEATEDESIPIPYGWRPTRSLRCAAGVDAETRKLEAPLARDRLDGKSDFFKNEKFEANFALLAGLQGAWQVGNDLDYGLAKVPAKAQLRVHRREVDGSWNYEVQANWQGNSWVNESSRRLGEMLAESGVSTLIFLPRNKHYSFTVGGNLILSEQLRATLRAPSPRVRAFLTLAEDELGLSSEVANLVERGISVHTSALLDTEKFASEEAFRDRSTIIMLATGTLAQGLNLPAVAVVIGGTQIGYTPGEAEEVLERRKLSQLLNAAGRAGRAGFANQGLVIAVPDSALYFAGSKDASEAAEVISYLSKDDAAVEILSPLKRLLDRIATGQFNAAIASPEELRAIAMLSGGSPKAPPAVQVLRRTYAAYLRRHSGLDEGAEAGADSLSELRNTFVAKSGAPDWLPAAAQRAGLDFFVTLRLFQAWKRAMDQLPSEAATWDTQTWLAAVFRAFTYLTPWRTIDAFGLRDLERFSPKLHAVAEATLTSERDDPNWLPTEQWVQGWQHLETLTKMWMNGSPIKEIASELLDLEAESVSSERTHISPIPKTLAFVADMIYNLAMLVGGIVALVEEELQAAGVAYKDGISQVPYELSALPLCVKYGCASSQILAWYRFGLRHRRPAHLLAEAFLLDPSIQDDGKLRQQVRLLRNQWLNGLGLVPAPLFSEHMDIFNAIRVVLTSQ